MSVLGLSIAILFFAAFTTLGSVLLAPLEDRFAKPDAMPRHVDGIVVLGGYMNGDVNAGRKGFELNSAPTAFSKRCGWRDYIQTPGLLFPEVMEPFSKNPSKRQIARGRCW